MAQRETRPRGQHLSQPHVCRGLLTLLRGVTVTAEGGGGVPRRSPEAAGVSLQFAGGVYITPLSSDFRHLGFFFSFSLSENPFPRASPHLPQVGCSGTSLSGLCGVLFYFISFLQGLLRDDSPWKPLDLHRCKTGVKGRGNSLKPKWQAGNPQPVIHRQLQEKPVLRTGNCHFPMKTVARSTSQHGCLFGISFHNETVFLCFS